MQPGGRDCQSTLARGRATGAKTRSLDALGRRPTARVERADMQTGYRVARRARWILALACIAAVGAPGSSAAPAPEAATLDPYRGLGTWVDIYDTGVWADPEGAVAAIAARGVRTVYLETSNFRQPVAIRRPALVARFLEAAHAQGMAVVAWYLPGFLNPSRDVQRSLAAITFTTPSGEGFDGFGLDIESPAVSSPALRTRRLLRVATDLREAVGAEYRLGAIIPSPRGLELSPTAWPGFPYEELAERFDVFLPMIYFTYRTTTAPAARAYVTRSIGVLRRETSADVRIHVIGGVADRTRAGQTKAFTEAVCAAGVMGGSMYDFATTGPVEWSRLSSLRDCTGR
jgi:hypothetical protein